MPSDRIGRYLLDHELGKGAMGTVFLARDPFPLSDVAAIMARMCDALATAHECGVIHRDVKSGNILLDNHGDTYNPVVLTNA